MRFKIDYNKVTEVGKYFKNKSDELDYLFSDVLDLIDEIDENYRSEESTIYISKFKDYVETFINENYYLNEGGKVLDKTSLLYNNQEDAWAKKVIQNELEEGRVDSVI